MFLRKYWKEQQESPGGLFRSTPRPWNELGMDGIVREIADHVFSERPLYQDLEVHLHANTTGVSLRAYETDTANYEGLTHQSLDWATGEVTPCEPPAQEL